MNFASVSPASSATYWPRARAALGSIPCIRQLCSRLSRCGDDAITMPAASVRKASAMYALHRGQEVEIVIIERTKCSLLPIFRQLLVGARRKRYP